MDHAGTWFEDHFIQLLDTEQDPLFQGVVKQLARASINQHTCHSLQHLSEPDRRTLMNHPAIGDPGAGRPLTLVNDKLYLTRFYNLEASVANQLAARNRALELESPGLVGQQINSVFGDNVDARQRLGALVSATRQLAIITGGPGTGKTSTVMNILEVLKSTSPSLTINLAAPTGKAAMRLGEAIGQQYEGKVTTVHRLLGMRGDGRSFRHDPDNPVRTDLLIVDEASMIDLVLMHRLLTALPDHARLILLGDPKQLPSVDTGNVLADICSGDSGFSSNFIEQHATLGLSIPAVATGEEHRLTDAIVELVTSHRFDPQSSIGRLASHLQLGDASWPEVADSSISLNESYELPTLESLWRDYFEQIANGEVSEIDLIERFNRARILCARRTGEFGVEAVNTFYERTLEAMNLKESGQAYYDGRPILVSRNDYRHELFNGDTGICRFNPENGEYVAYFLPDKSVPVKHLPEHETCFAMTVHKSQGSEFDYVVLILDDDSTEESEALMTKELVYTAVTRARHQFAAISTQSRWQAALARSATRDSGMAELLKRPH